ncbi:MAG: glutamate decarboxylase [Acidobacteria bacterium]|nr:glutamate decarboxylase [Acidobacteriota bacterium]MBU2437837.1 glutamate decarboxylase [Acidobacteriota bacterium]
MTDRDKFLDDRIRDIINTYIRETESDLTPVTRHAPPSRLIEEMDLSLSREGCSLEALYTFIEEYLKNSVRTGHRQYYNQLWSGFSLPGLLGEMITALTNTSMYTYEVAPVATILETELVKKMGGLVGYPDPEGQFVTGGSNGNLLAMMIARNRERADARRKGIRDGQRLVAFVSDQAHYSFEKAANVIGIGSDQVKKVPSDIKGAMIPEELEKMLEDTMEQGLVPFFIGATAGTTVKGAFDPCESIAAIAAGYKIWFHIDASHGGGVFLSPKWRHLTAGSEKSDSIIWNAHKMMGLPITCSMFLVREKGHMLQTFTVSGTDYIFHDHELGVHDLGPQSLQCGRRVDALKLWLSLKYYGDDAYAARIEKFFALSAYAENIVTGHSNLELMAERTSVNICFRYTSPHIRDLNAFNKKVREEMASRGLNLVNYAFIGCDLVIRLVLLNHEAEKADIDRFFDNFIRTAEGLLEKGDKRGLS